MLSATPREQTFTIDQLHPTGGNTLFTAQYKAGKTTAQLNLVKALADGEGFLGEFAVAPLSGRVGYWNYEMDPDTFRAWMRDLGIRHPERVAVPLHLRGVVLPLGVEEVAERAAAWLKGNDVEFLIVDPAARAWQGMVQSENDNSQIAAFTDALDFIKREGGVRDLLLTAHMGRERFENGQERARGATRLEDWMDAGWYLRKHPTTGRRSLRAMGRDVELAAIELEYDTVRRTLLATGRTTSEGLLEDGAYRAVAALAKFAEPPTTSALAETILGEKKYRTSWIRAASNKGFIERRYKDGTPFDENAPRPGIALRCNLTDSGRELLASRSTRAAANDPTTPLEPGWWKQEHES